MVSILQFGAVGDGRFLNTQPINKAIQQCAADGGGTVIVPPGVFLSGPITLLSNVTLHLEAGATLLSTPDLSQFPSESGAESHETLYAGLVTARRAENVSIVGRGTIDGNGLKYVYPGRPKVGETGDFRTRYTRQKDHFMDTPAALESTPWLHGERPGDLVRFLDCRNVLLRDITIANAPTWTVHFTRSSQINVIGVNIHSRGSDLRVPNDDGMDFTDCNRVHIAHCDIETGDDCIAIFGGQGYTVTNCTLTSRSAGVRIGYVGTDIRDAVFSNLVMHTNRGVNINVRGSSSIENVRFSNVVMRTHLVAGHWWGKAEPIQISAVPLNENEAAIGSIRNISFSDIFAESENGVVIYGSPNALIQDISLRNVRLRMLGGPLQEAIGGNFDLRGVANLAEAIFEHDIPAIYARYVKGLRLEDVELDMDVHVPAYFKAEVQHEHSTDIDDSGFRLKAHH